MSGIRPSGGGPPVKKPFPPPSSPNPARSLNPAEQLTALGGGKQPVGIRPINQPPGGLKRPIPQGAQGGGLQKKPKLPPGGRSSPVPLGQPPAVGAAEVTPPDEDLADKVLAMDESTEAQAIHTMIVGALQYMRSTVNLNLLRVPYINLLVICKKKPNFFTAPPVVKELLSMLRPTGRDKKALASMVYVLVCSLLHWAYNNVDLWPEAFVHAYLEDAMHERNWVELELNRGFVDNIMTAFETRGPTSTTPVPMVMSPKPAQLSPKTEAPPVDGWLDEEVMDESMATFHDPTNQHAPASLAPNQNTAAVPNPPHPGNASPTPPPGPAAARPAQLAKPRVSRYNNEEMQRRIKEYAMDRVSGVVKGTLPTEGLKGLVRVLVVLTCYKEMRLLLSQHVETWLNHPSTTQGKIILSDLVPALVKATRLLEDDLLVVVNMTKVRLKHHMFHKQYLEQLERLLCTRKEYVRVVLHEIMIGEISLQVNQQPNLQPNPAKTFDMQLLSHILSPTSRIQLQMPEFVFAGVVLELLVQAPQMNFLIIRSVLRRVIVKNLQHNFNFRQFVAGMTAQNNLAALNLNAENKNNYAYAIVDIICYVPLLCISPQIMDEFNKEMTPGGRAKLDGHKALRQFQEGVADVQDMGVRWLRCESHVFWPFINTGTHDMIVSKLLYLYQFDDYARPHESLDKDVKMDQKVGLDVVQSCIPVRETMLLNLAELANTAKRGGVSPLTQDHGLSMLQIATTRAAQLENIGGRALAVNQYPRELIDSFLGISEVLVRPTRPYPQGYQPPRMAVTSVYWRACQLLLIVAARNPSTVGALLWNHNPTLKMLLEMAIIRIYKYPPLATSGDATEEVVIQDLMVQRKEKDDALFLESMVAPPDPSGNPRVFTEATSQWVGHVMYLRPESGPARRPPVETLAEVSRLNSTLHLGDNLCCCRHPDYLLEVLERTQMTGASMNAKWLVPIVENTGASVDQMPTKVLSEYLFVKLLNEKDRQSKEMEQTEESAEANTEGRVDIDIVERVVGRLHGAHGAAFKEVVAYFMAKLANKQCKFRAIAGRALNTILYPSVPRAMGGPLPPKALSECAWLDQPLAEEHGEEVCWGLRPALKVETRGSTLAAYLRFLCRYCKIVDVRLQQAEEDEERLRISRGELVSIVVDVSKFLMERPDVAHSVFSVGTGLGPAIKAEREAVYCQLLELYGSTLEWVMYQERAEFSALPWDMALAYQAEANEILVMYFEEQQVFATIPRVVLDALVLCLTFYQPSDLAEDGASLHESLLVRLCPYDEEDDVVDIPYRLYWKKTREPAKLFSDLLRKRMLQTKCRQLIAAAMDGISSDCLLDVVESRMDPLVATKVLTALDQRVATEGPKLLANVREEAQHLRIMQQVRVQQSLGSTGGTALLQVVEQMVRPQLDQLAKAVQAAKQASLQVAPGHYRPRRNVPSGLPAAGLLDAQALQLATSTQPITENPPGLQPGDTVRRLCAMYPAACHPSTSTGAPPPPGPEISALAKEANLLAEKWAQELKDGVEQTGYSGEECVGALRVLRVLRSAHFEGVLDGLMAVAMDQDTNAEGRGRSIGLLAQLLAPAREGPSGCTHNGLLLDWLQALDPDMHSQIPDSAMSFVFRQNPSTATDPPADKAGRSSMPQRGYPLLLSLLLHQGGWDTVQRCLTLLLARPINGPTTSDSTNDSQRNPTLVLDFVAACVRHPRAWKTSSGVQRGRVEKTFRTVEFTVSQAVALAHLISQEMLLRLQQCSPQPEDTLQPSALADFPAEVHGVVDLRTPLLTYAVRGHPDSLQAVVQHLQHRGSPSGWEVAVGGLCAELLVQLYMVYPHMLGTLAAPNTVTARLGTVARMSQMELVLHRLLLTLVNGSGSKKGAHAAYTLCRSIAATHPALVLRYVQTLASGLKGRMNVAMEVFVERGHHRLFEYVLQIIDLLRPDIFHKNMRKRGFDDIFEVYMALLVAVRMSREERVESLVKKWVEFLAAYVAYDLDLALAHITPHLQVLMDIFQLYPEATKTHRTLLIALQAGRAPATDHPHTHTDDIENHRRSLRDPARVREALGHLEHKTLRQPGLLPPLIGEIVGLMTSPSDDVRATAFTLAMRYVKFNPRGANDVLQTYLARLDPEAEPAAIELALKHASDLYVYCTDHMEYLLMKIFMLSFSHVPVVREVQKLLGSTRII